MRITKVQGFCLVVVLTLISMYFYLSYFTRSAFESSSYHWGAWFFFVGLLFSRFGVNEVGSHGYLAFNGSALRNTDGSYVIWKDGMYFIPTLFPPLNVIGIPFGWTMKHSSESAIAVRPVTPEADNHVFIDQRLPRYNINSDVGYWQQTFGRLFENLIGWVFSYNPTNELRYQKIGTVLMAIGLAAGWGLKQNEEYFPSLQPTVTTGTERLNFTLRLPDFSPREDVKVIPQVSSIPPTVLQPRIVNGFITHLTIGQAPRYPSQADFTPEPKNVGAQPCYLDVDGITYCRYVDGDDQTLRDMPASSCKIVPAGKQVLLQSDSPPRYTINMEESVTYSVKKQNGLFSPQTFQQRTGTWSILRDSWNVVNLRTQGIIATALPQSTLYSTEYGGLVCF